MRRIVGSTLVLLGLFVGAVGAAPPGPSRFRPDARPEAWCPTGEEFDAYLEAISLLPTRVDARGREAGPPPPAVSFHDGVLVVEDAGRILRNDRVRVITPDGVRWLARLANVRGWGSLGFAIAVARMGFDIASKMPLDVDDLRSALRMTIGPQAVEEIDEAAGGELLRKAV